MPGKAWVASGTFLWETALLVWELGLAEWIEGNGDKWEQLAGRWHTGFWVGWVTSVLS